MTRLQNVLATPPKETEPEALGTSCLHDLRFRTLLGPDAWSRLPPAVRHRFGRRLAAGTAVTYVGTIVDSRRTRAGRMLVNLCRLIGDPLPLEAEIAVPAVVTVTEDGATGGQCWTRLYGRPRGFPQVVHSSKRFAGPTGLEEYLGYGLGIALTVTADEKGLRFLSDHYFVEAGGIRLRLPSWLAPGRLSITHRDLGDGLFAFVLSLHHRLFGEIVSQTGIFRERPDRDGGHPQ